MPTCDMCGKKTELMFRTLIEGVEISVCEQCSSFGKVLRQVKLEQQRPAVKKQIAETKQEPELIDVIVEDYAELIRKAREKLNLKQEELALKINERESLIQNVERGKIKPSLNLARKFEKFLNIKLIETFEDSKTDVQKIKGEAMTVGDLIKIKKP